MMRMIKLSKEKVKARTTRSRTKEDKRIKITFKEWSKENVTTRTARSRTREGNRLSMTSSLESLKIN
ncbi:hypothetical protein T06_6802 [Trichinella sp. T6]|nr:hypothetical protein T06_11136 [Trichinella sp. T6]KRX70114.1 hypothetical protein T06_6802 [Trichinella sp. T6]